MEKWKNAVAAPAGFVRSFRFGAGGLCAALLLALFAAPGCVSTPVRPTPPAVLPELQVDEATAASRLTEFRKLFRNLPLRAVRLYPDSFVGHVDPERVAARIEDLGFNRVIVAVSSEEELDELLAELLGALGRKGLPVFLELRQRDFFGRHQGNAFKRLFVPEHPTLEEAARLVAEYNDDLPQASRIAGLVIAIEPQIFTASNPDRPRDLMFCWSETSYGPGLDNELLVRHSLEQLARIAAASRLPIAVEMPDFFQDMVEAGKLGVGSAADFVAAAGGNPPFVIVASAGNRPTETVDCLYREAAAMPHGVPMLAGITLADHTSRARGALRRRDWSDFLRAMALLQRRFHNMPAFSGVAIDPLRQIEFMRLQK